MMSGDVSLRPLQGCRVIDLTRALAGPFCTMILADLGADVVKIESPPGGDMSRSWGPFVKNVSVYYLSVNRNKRSLALDLRTTEGIDVVQKMASQADVLVENFRPGVTESMGLGYELLAKENPQLVYGSVSAFGRGGPYESWPGFDQIAQGMSGFMSVTGTSDTGPLRVGLPIADLAAGMWAAIGVLAAVLQCRAGGCGQRVDVSLLGSLIGMLGVQGQRYLSLGEIARPMANDHPVLAPYGTFETADGLLNIAVATEPMWRALCALLDLGEFVDHPDYKNNTARVAHRDALKRLLEERLRTRTKEDWVPRCIGAGIPAGPVNGIGDALDDPHVAATGCLEAVEHPILGTVRQLASPIHLSNCPEPSSRTSPPLLGEHTSDVLRSFGFVETTIDHLLKSGIVVESALAARPNS